MEPLYKNVGDLRVELSAAEAQEARDEWALEDYKATIPHMPSINEKVNLMVNKGIEECRAYCQNIEKIRSAMLEKYDLMKSEMAAKRKA